MKEKSVMMKKILCAVIAAALLCQTPQMIYAASPSGLKDVETTDEVMSSAAIDVKLETKGNNLVVNNNIPYTVRIKAGNKKSFVATITATCGNREEIYDVMVASNTSYEHTYILNDCPNGENTLKISVAADGAELAVYSNKVTVAPVVERYYLDEVTTKLGYNTPYDHTTYRDTITVNGARAMRTELGRWTSIEKKKGNYDFSDATNSYMNKVEDMGIEITTIAGMNNPLYMDSGTGNGPDSKTNIDGFAKYAAAIAKQFPNIRFSEIWNEPNISFWINPNPIDYAYAAEVSKYETEQFNPDTYIMVGSVANGDSKFINNFLAQGIWANVDSISYHPYTRPSTVDQAMKVHVKGCHDTIIEYGGWKVPVCSEIGWPSNNIGVGITEEQQAIEYAKVYIFETSYGVPMTIIHNTFDTSFDQTSSTEDHYGIVYPDWTTKPSFFSTREVNNQTNGAVHVGKVFFDDNPDIQMHLYARDNKIHAAVWTKGEPTSVDFGETVSAYDMIGNPKAVSNKIEIGEEITYIHGLDRNWFIKGYADSMKEFYDDNIDVLGDCIDKKGFSKACALLLSAVDKANELKSIPNEEDALALLREHYGLGRQIIDMYKNGELDIPFERFTGLLYINQLMAEKTVNLYMLSADSEVSGMNSEKAVNDAENFINQKRGEHTLAGAQAILKYAKERRNSAYEIAKKSGTNEMKNGYIKALDEQGILLAEEAKAVAEAEVPGNKNILLQLPSSQANIDLGKEQTINLSLYNYRKSEPLTGYAEIIAPDGTVVGKSETVTLTGYKSMLLPVKVIVDKAYDGDFAMKFFENEEEIVSRQAPIKIKDQIKVKFAPVMKTFDEIESITVNIENVYDKDISGKLDIAPRCGWTLSSTTQNFNVKKGEKISLTFPVVSKEKEPFNFYTFDIKIINDEGKNVYSKYLPIDFTVISKAEYEMSPADFTGDISNWSDAYPIYCDTPQNPEDYDEWLTEDIGARMMMKWDDNYYYMLCDVYDQFHANMQVGSNIWNGDSLQLAWDTLNDGGHDYKSDDYEYGFALTENGTQVYCWMAGYGKAGERPTEWTSIYNNAEEHLTRYFMRIPKEYLTPLNFKEGNVFGFNFLVNDADWSTREKDIEYTYGISKSKDPESFEDFKLVGIENQIPGQAKIPIPLTMEASDKAQEPENRFTDISGHWAEKYINKVAAAGGISGFSDGTYRPSRKMTRAEFVTALVKTMEKKEQGKSRFADVTADKWYSGAVGAIEEFIPAEMADMNFYPNKEITRQEAVYLLNKWAESKASTDASYRFMADMKDVDEIALYARESFQKLYNHRVINGDENGMLNPNGDITRAEAAVMLGKVMDLI